MDAASLIYEKLEAFIKKFYINELMKGAIMFIGLGLFYLLFTLTVENFFWFKPLGRTILFCFFIVVESFLLIRYIFFPLLQLFRSAKGIDYQKASIIIGNHFAEIDDKLTNFIQLLSDKNQSELLLASIEQRAKDLKYVSFGKAINLNSNAKYLPFAILPISVFVAFYITGNVAYISQSFNRVVNFYMPFVKPASFKFVIINSILRTYENQDFVLKLRLNGKVLPENVIIIIGAESYFMESMHNGVFEFKFSNLLESTPFYFKANSFYSADYTLEVVKVPTILDFDMKLKYPSYLKMSNKTIKGNGNALVPEGTKINWNIKARATANIFLTDSLNNASFTKAENLYSLSKIIKNDFNYHIVTSNLMNDRHEDLEYKIAVIKDKYPSIAVNSLPDSIAVDKKLLFGQISDDYGISKLHVVYYTKDSPENILKSVVPINNGKYDRFVFSFPGNLKIREGEHYEFYFEVFDNDELHNYKSTKSNVFSSYISTESEIQEQVFEQQNNNLEYMENVLKNQQIQMTAIEQIKKNKLLKTNNDFKDRQQINEFVKRQKEQNDLMLEYSKKMRDNLEQLKSDNNDEMKKGLQNRIDKAVDENEKNKKLLDELNELNEKISSEKLNEKIDNIEQRNKNQIKNLAQLVQLTKKYYVEKKTAQISDNLKKLSEEQEALSEDKIENKAAQQEEINKSFNKLKKQLDELNKQNSELNSPMELPKTAQTEKDIKEDLDSALKETKSNKNETAKPKQKNASKKMEEMSEQLAEGIEKNAEIQMKEDFKMLRQILDNLLVYSFSQEEVMNKFKTIKEASPSFSKYIKQQQNLKIQFKHIDDSLFVMSLRNPKIAENVTKEIGNVQYNMDKAIYLLSDSNFSKGSSHLHYSVSAANKLADVLSNTQNDMKMSMSGSGKLNSQPEEMQLPDIIKKQKQLGDKLEKQLSGSQDDEKGDKKDDKTKMEGNKWKETKHGKDKDGEIEENNAQEILEIYKEQQQLRNSLESELKKQGLSTDGKNITEQMKQLEKKLLNKGFADDALKRSKQIEQDLLKLERAFLQKGIDNKRQSKSNDVVQENTAKKLPHEVIEYLNNVELLNREDLPLQEDYEQKTQFYFNKK